LDCWRRAFASERLAESGELALVRRRHAAWALALGEQADRELDSSAQPLWLERLEEERGNLRAALDWARTSGEPEAVEWGLRLAATLWLFWDVRGHMQEGREPLAELLGLPGAQGRTRYRAGALLAAAWLGYVKGDVAEVERVVEDCLAISRELGDARSIARALAILGTTLAAYSSDSERTATVLSDALDIAQPLGDTWSIGFALYNMGVLAMRAGRLAEAEGPLEECRAVSTASGNTFGIACSVFRLGWVALTKGDRDRGLDLLKESLRLNWELRNRRVVALCLEQLACVAGGSRSALELACLFGAAEGLLEQLPEYTLPPQMVDAHQRGAAAAREVLGEKAFREVWARGRLMPMEQAVAFGLGDPAAGFPTDDVDVSPLSGREREIVQLVARGMTDQEVGSKLSLSKHTVGNHLRRIFGKTNVRSRASLVMWAVRSGVISSTEQ
jgi:DNA-binding CsgD family transcriptional regulator